MINTKPLSWEEFDRGIQRLMGAEPPKAEHPLVAPLIEVARAAEPLQPKAKWWVRAADFLSSRARDLALVLIVIGTGIAVFQGSLTSATLFGFTGIASWAFALMPDALMVISASKMREKDVSPVQRKEARLSMQIGLLFSLVSNMIAALYIANPGLFTPVVVLCGTVAYHGMTVVFLWRAVETVTKTRQDAPSVNAHVQKARKAAAAAAAKKAQPTQPRARKAPVKGVSSKNVKASQVKG